MRILLNEEEYSLSSETETQMINQGYQLILERYEGLGKTLRLALMPLSRHILMEMEKKHGKIIRPGKGEDPSLHLVKLMLGVLIRGLPNVTAQVTTKAGTTEIQSFDLSITGEGESGGQVALDGNVGLGEDNGGETLRPEFEQVVSNVTPLYPRLEN